jgi:hypothetical protein
MNLISYGVFLFVLLLAPAARATANGNLEGRSQSVAGTRARWTMNLWSAEVVVPPLPAVHNAGEVIDLWGGIQDATEVLQPLLEWSGGGWSIYTIACCDAPIQASAHVPVAPGDMLLMEVYLIGLSPGNVVETCADGSLKIGREWTWQMSAYDLATNVSSHLSVVFDPCSLHNGPFDTTVGAMYEVADDAACQSPANVTFTNETLYYGTEAAPTTVIALAPAFSPFAQPPAMGCTYGSTESGSTLTLF